MSWKENRTLKFAVGLVVVIVALKWLFTPTLSDAYLAFVEPAPDENVQSDAFTGLAKIMPFFDLVFAILIGIGAWILDVGEFAFTTAKNRLSGGGAKVSSRGAAQAPVDADQLVTQLAQATARNDEKAVEQLGDKIRRPYAIDELTTALEQGDLKTADERFAELKALIKPAKTTRSKG